MTLRPKALFATLCLAVLLTGCSTLMEHNSSDGLKGLLGTPLVLLLLMFFASFVNALKQKSDAKANGNPMTFAEYFGHLPETIAVVFANLLVFITLLSNDQLDDSAPLGLKVAAVIAIGYGLNSAGDKVTKDGRSAAVAGRSPS